MKDYAESFYKGKTWEKLSKFYLSSKLYICERCGAMATICHHKIWITPENIKDFNISLNTDNLEALCINCHNTEHQRPGAAVYFNSDGDVAHIKEDESIKALYNDVAQIDDVLLKAKELQRQLDERV